MCEKAVTEFFRLLTPCAKKLLLAVSGGGDSVALLHLCVRLRESLGIERIDVAHINHGLRGGESDAEADFVAELAQKSGLILHCHRLSGKASGDSGLEEWARRQRYAFLSDLKQQHGFDFIATGHTAEDQAETVLLNLLRGTGLSGLCGIKPRREDGVIRPLLSLHRARLRQWLTERSLSWQEDSSNTDPRFKRNWIRHSVLPLLQSSEPAAVGHLAACSQRARDFATFLEPQINTWMSQNVVTGSNASFSLHKEGLRKEPFLASEGLVRLLKRHEIPCEQQHVARIMEASSRSSGEFLLPGGWRFFPDRRRVEFRRGKAEPAVPFCVRLRPAEVLDLALRAERVTLEVYPDSRHDQIRFDASNMTAYLDAELLGSELEYRSVRPGDRFMPLGATEPHPLEHILKSQGVPRARREEYGIVGQAAGAVAWVPGVAISQLFRITDTTRLIARLSLAPFNATNVD